MFSCQREKHMCGSPHYTQPFGLAPASKHNVAPCSDQRSVTFLSPSRPFSKACVFTDTLRYSLWHVILLTSVLLSDSISCWLKCIAASCRRMCYYVHLMMHWCQSPEQMYCFYLYIWCYDIIKCFNNLGKDCQFLTWMTYFWCCLHHMLLLRWGLECAGVLLWHSPDRQNYYQGGTVLLKSWWYFIAICSMASLYQQFY